MFGQTSHVQKSLNVGSFSRPFACLWSMRPPLIGSAELLVRQSDGDQLLDV